MSNNSWVPLESNPDVFQQLTEQLCPLMTAQWQDVWDMDEQMPEAQAFVFLYSVAGEQAPADDVPPDSDDNVYYIR